MAGWYHSPMTVGPESKLIQTIDTLYTSCVTHGPLRTYKLFVRAYGGKSDDDLDGRNAHTETTQKWVNFYDIMLGLFNGEGRCVTIDSAYMGNIMAQIGTHKWKFNMVGTSNENRTGTDVKLEKDGLEKGSYQSVLFQHKSKQLTYAMWADNNIVQTLSNYHSPKIVKEVLKRMRKVDGVHECAQTPVSCPLQNKK